MSQQVLCCHKCRTFQVFQLRKDPKWVCKLCNEKQSMKQIFGRGTGAECRKLVQELNIKKADLHSDFKMIPNDEEDPSEFPEDSSLVTSSASNVKKPSKWDKYL